MNESTLLLSVIGTGIGVTAVVVSMSPSSPAA